MKPAILTTPIAWMLASCLLETTCVLAMQQAGFVLFAGPSILFHARRSKPRKKEIAVFVGLGCAVSALAVVIGPPAGTLVVFVGFLALFLQTSKPTAGLDVLGGSAIVLAAFGSGFVTSPALVLGFGCAAAALCLLQLRAC